MLVRFIFINVSSSTTRVKIEPIPFNVSHWRVTKVHGQHRRNRAWTGAQCLVDTEGKTT